MTSRKGRENTSRYLEQVYGIVSKVWYGFYRCVNSLYACFLRLDGRMQDVFPGVSKHSPAGRVAVTLFTVMSVLIGSMVVVELIYHARPYYWMLLNTVLYLLYVVSMFIITMICKMFTAFHGAVTLTVKSVVLVIARMFSVVIHSVLFTLRVAWLGLEFVVHAANWIIKACLIVTFTVWKVLISCLFVGLVSVGILRGLKEKHPVKVVKPEVARGRKVESKSTESKAKERRGPVRFPATDVARVVVICSDQLLGKCAKGSQCPYFHCSLPYYWLYKLVDTEQWKSFLTPDNVKIERLFCDALEKNTAVETTLGINYFTSTREKWRSLLYSLNFDEMTMAWGNSHQASLRRLSTPSYIQEPCAVLSTKWVWYWLDNDGWKQYGAGEGSTGPKQEDIEAAYIGGDKLFPFNTSSHDYHITFCDVLMYQRNLDPKYLTMRNVRRRPLYVSETDLQEIKRSADSLSASRPRLPSHWTTLPPDRDFVRVALSKSREFDEVKKLFHETIKKHEGSILEVERVQNPFLWERYARKRDQMKRKLKRTINDEIERKLFHGTSSFVVDAICKQNFDHRLHGKHGTLYGEGSYFSTKASYSNSYSNQLDGSKTKFMFVASILTGTYTEGNRSMRRPPSRDPSDPASDLYDSCVDNVDSPSIFVIFHDEQCYPLYLIKYVML